jgi:hypothetical protein
LCDAKHNIKKYADVYFSEIMTENRSEIYVTNDKKAEIKEFKGKEN